MFGTFTFYCCNTWSINLIRYLYVPLVKLVGPKYIVVNRICKINIAWESQTFLEALDRYCTFHIKGRVLHLHSLQSSKITMFGFCGIPNMHAVYVLLGLLKADFHHH